MPQLWFHLLCFWSDVEETAVILVHSCNILEHKANVNKAEIWIICYLFISLVNQTTVISDTYLPSSAWKATECGSQPGWWSSLYSWGTKPTAIMPLTPVSTMVTCTTRVDLLQGTRTDLWLWHKTAYFVGLHIFFKNNILIFTNLEQSYNIARSSR